MSFQRKSARGGGSVWGALAAWGAQACSQFRHLDRDDPSSWPVLPRALLCAAVALLAVLLLWGLWLRDFSATLEAERAREQQLRQGYVRKLGQAIHLDQLKQQRQQVEQSVTQLEKQLPSKAEMDALLSDINQAGLGRGLAFELFRPGAVIRRDYYAEQPIAVRVVGTYHDIGAFVADVAQLSRIVTLNDLALAQGKDGKLVLDATAKTFRYLDASEIEAQRLAKAQTKAPRR
ncbi:MAG: type 4a pilus biogenesis protein PilO [Comamonas sp.]